MEKVYTRTKGIQPDMVDGFCPGCMHSTLFKLIGEVLEEMDMLDKCTCAIGVGCCGLGMGYFTYDYLLAAHGRACAVATGAKRSNPDTLVFTYQGDGDLASIGLAETMSAANRGGEYLRDLCKQRYLRHDRRTTGPHHAGGHEGHHRA